MKKDQYRFNEQQPVCRFCRHGNHEGSLPRETINWIMRNCTTFYNSAEIINEYLEPLCLPKMEMTNHRTATRDGRNGRQDTEAMPYGEFPKTAGRNML